MRCENCTIKNLCRYTEEVQKYLAAVEEAGKELAKIEAVETEVKVSCKHYRRVK
jgi:hypothetical protein